MREISHFRCMCAPLPETEIEKINGNVYCASTNAINTQKVNKHLNKIALLPDFVLSARIFVDLFVSYYASTQQIRYIIFVMHNVRLCATHNLLSFVSHSLRMLFWCLPLGLHYVATHTNTVAANKMKINKNNSWGNHFTIFAVVVVRLFASLLRTIEETSTLGDLYRAENIHKGILRCVKSRMTWSKSRTNKICLFSTCSNLIHFSSFTVLPFRCQLENNNNFIHAYTAVARK